MCGVELQVTSVQSVMDQLCCSTKTLRSICTLCSANSISLRHFLFKNFARSVMRRACVRLWEVIVFWFEAARIALWKNDVDMRSSLPLTAIPWWLRVGCAREPVFSFVENIYGLIFEIKGGWYGRWESLWFHVCSLIGRRGPRRACIKRYRWEFRLSLV